MQDHAATTPGQALTDLILSVFRTNSLMVTWGDRLVGSLGLTSARWQVLGAIVASERPQPVAWLARDLGGNRQNVQRIVNDLAKEGLVTFQPNPHHRRAQLVVLTDKGQHIFDAAIALYTPGVNSFAKDIPVTDILVAQRVMAMLRARVEETAQGDEPF